MYKTQPHVDRAAPAAAAIEMDAANGSEEVEVVEELGGVAAAVGDADFQICEEAEAEVVAAAVLVDCSVDCSE